MFRVGQNHVYTVYIRYFWQGNYEIYVHIWCIYTILANPTHSQHGEWKEALTVSSPGLQWGREGSNLSCVGRGGDLWSSQEAKWWAAACFDYHEQTESVDHTCVDYEVLALLSILYICVDFHWYIYMRTSIAIYMCGLPLLYIYMRTSIAIYICVGFHCYIYMWTSIAMNEVERRGEGMRVNTLWSF